MAFTATLTNVERVDQTLNVEVQYDDSVSGFSIKRVFNFQNGDTVTIIEIRNEVIRVGTKYKDGLSTYDTLKTHIGDVITI